jgi:hypothetical protein
MSFHGQEGEVPVTDRKGESQRLTFPRLRQETPREFSDGSSSRDQVNYSYHQRDHQEKMNQTAGNVKSPAQKPEDDQNRENCPKHAFSLQRQLCCPPVRSGFLGRSCLRNQGNAENGY